MSDGGGTRDLGHEGFLRHAIALATENVRAGGGPFGAVVVRRGEIVAQGVNRVTPDHDPTAHAEVVAIRGACAALGDFHLPGCVIYTSCEPCPMCLGAIYWARLEAVYYGSRRDHAAAAGFSDDQIYREIPLPPGERSIPARQLLTDEAEEPFAAWQRAEHRVPY